MAKTKKKASNMKTKSNIKKASKKKATKRNAPTSTSHSKKVVGYNLRDHHRRLSMALLSILILTVVLMLNYHMDIYPSWPNINMGASAAKAPSVITPDKMMVEGITIITDKEIYHSNEIIKITAFVNAHNDMSDAEVRFQGIYASTNRIDYTETVDLNEGQNKVEFSYRAPSCFGCAGIKPGVYNINVEMRYEDQLIGTDSINIEMQE